MKVVAAYLLALLGGNASPSSDDLKSVLGSVGAEADDERLDFLLSQLQRKDIAEVIASGREKFASVPGGGGGASVVVAAAGGGGGGGGGGTAAPADRVTEEAKAPEEESDDDMGFGLFD